MMNKKKNIFIIGFILLFLGIITLLLFQLRQKDKKSNILIGFYKIESSLQDSLESIIKKIGTDNNIICNFEVITNDTFNMTSKYDLVFTTAGFAQKKVSKFSPANTSISSDITNGMFSSAAESVIRENNKIKAIPILFDNLEIDIEISEFKMSGLKQIATWEDIENFLKIEKNKNDYPICFAGNDVVLLLDLLGALTESFEGINAYNEAVKILEKYQKEFNVDKLIKELFFTDDAPLYSSLVYLNNLKTKEYLNPASQFFIKNDVESNIINRVTNVIFTTLSDHRKMNVNAITRYSTIYFPSITNSKTRNFTATGTYAIPLKNKESNEIILKELLSAENQTELCCSTGLSPVLANCMVPDKQSADTRFWIAATNAPLAGLGHEVEFTDEQLNEILSKINSYIF